MTTTYDGNCLQMKYGLCLSGHTKLTGSPLSGLSKRWGPSRGCWGDRGRCLTALPLLEWQFLWRRWEVATSSSMSSACLGEPPPVWQVGAAWSISRKSRPAVPNPWTTDRYLRVCKQEEECVECVDTLPVPGALDPLPHTLYIYCTVDFVNKLLNSFFSKSLSLHLSSFRLPWQWWIVYCSVNCIMMMLLYFVSLCRPRPTISPWLKTEWLLSFYLQVLGLGGQLLTLLRILKGPIAMGIWAILIQPLQEFGPHSRQ